VGNCVLSGACRMSDDINEEEESNRAQDAREHHVRVGGAFIPDELPSHDKGFGFEPPKLDIPAHAARTARTLTFVVVAMLGLSIALQYGTMGVLIAYNKTEAIPTFEHLFNAVFPVLAGLTGSAVTYYLTKDKK